MIPIPPGVFDILPKSEKEWQNSLLWNFVETVIRQTAKDFGFKEIRTPIFERTELFTRSVGETSDIVTKEMYTFQDKGDRSMTLRPEGTASVMRSFIENNLHMISPVTKLFYIGPMFRYERAQAGRYRQHHQFGVEAIGNNSPLQDAELIAMLYTLYNRLGIKNLSVYINSIGNPETRKRFKTALKDYYKEYFQNLSTDSKIRFEKNPLRILDSKDAKDIEINKNAPSVLDYLDTDCSEHFKSVQTMLTSLKIPFTLNNKLVRGLDYYNKTVFEITAGELGAQNSVGAGGRYDGLLKSLGGPDLPTIGFGTGIERIIQTMLGQEVTYPKTDGPSLFIIPLGDEAKAKSFILLQNLRQEGISAEMDYSGKKLGKAMQYANAISAKYVAVIGENELKTGIFELKEMESGIAFKLPITSLSRILKIEAGQDQFLKNWKEISKPFQDRSEIEFFTKKILNEISDAKNTFSDLHQSVEIVDSLLKE